MAGQELRAAGAERSRKSAGFVRWRLARPAAVRPFLRVHRAFLTFLAAWVVVFGAARTAQHLSFGTNACDLSLFDYGIRSTLRGPVMAEPFHQYGFGRWVETNGELGFERGGARPWHSHFTIHFTPIAYLFAPFTLVFRGPLYLLWFQVIFVGLSGLMLYLIAVWALGRTAAAAAIAAAYLLFRHLLMGLMHDFHFEMLFPFLFFAAFYVLAVRRKPWLYFAALVAALAIKEDVAVLMLFFGLYAAVFLKERGLGAATAAISAAWLLVAIGVVIPHFRAEAGLAGRYAYAHILGAPDQGLIATLAALAAHPGRIVAGVPTARFAASFAAIVGPLGFLPFFTPAALLIVPPVVIALVSKIPQNYMFGIHYGATLLPFVFLSLVFGIKAVSGLVEKRSVRRAGGASIDTDSAPANAAPRSAGKRTGRAAVVIAAVLLAANLINSNAWRILDPGRYRAIGERAVIMAAARSIPPHASVAALSALIPNLPVRRDISMLPDAGGPGGAEYVLVHTGLNPWPYTKAQLGRFAARMRADRSYAVAAESGGFVMFRKVASPGEVIGK